MTMLNEKDDGGQSIQKKGIKHKFSVTVTSFQDDVFYPMEVISPSDIVVIEADVKRVKSGDPTEATTEVQFLEVRLF